MQSVSAAFKAAATAVSRKPKLRLNCWFLELSTAGAGVFPYNDPLDATYFPKSQLSDGVTAPNKKWALARDDCFPADDLYPIDAGNEGGWFSNQASNGSAVVNETIALTVSDSVYEGPMIQTFGWTADSWLGYPVDFVIKYTPPWPGEETTLVTVTGHAAATYEYTHSVPLECTSIKFQFTKISRANSHLYLAELLVGLHVDISDYVISANVVRDRNVAEQGAPPLGNYGASQLTLTLDNSDKRFSARNTAGPYHGMILPNRRLDLEFGFELSDGTTEWCDAGRFFVRKWTSDSLGRTSVIALDGSQRLSGKWYEAAVREGATVSELIEDLAVAAGVNLVDMAIDATTEVIPYAVFSGASVLSYMKELATANGGCLYFDEAGKLVFDAIGGLGGVIVATLTDSNVVVRCTEEIDESTVYNLARVTGKRYKEEAESTIWNLQETLSLAVGTTYVSVRFSGPAVDVQNPVLVDADAHIAISTATYYSQSGLLKIVNAGSAAEEIRAMTIDGKLLTEDGSLVVESENGDSVTAYGERSVPVANNFIQSYAQAKALADAIANGKADPGRYLPELELTCGGLPHLQLGDKIHLHNTHLAVDDDVYVLGMTLRWDKGLHGSLRVLCPTPIGPTAQPAMSGMAE